MFKELEEITKAQHKQFLAIPKFRQSSAESLLYFHSGFRSNAKKMLQIVKCEGKLDYKFLNYTFYDLIQVLHAHHSIEERSLFPDLQRRFGLNLESLHSQVSKIFLSNNLQMKHDLMHKKQKNVEKLLDKLDEEYRDEVAKNLKTEVEAFWRFY